MRRVIDSVGGTWLRVARILSDVLRCCKDDCGYLACSDKERF